MERLFRQYGRGVGGYLLARTGDPELAEEITARVFLTVVRRYYGLREELFEVTITTHPEGRYTYTMDMQRALRPRL